MTDRVNGATHGLPSKRRSFPKLLKPAYIPDNFTKPLYEIAPYKGCTHGCCYCDGGTERYYAKGDFESKIEIRRSIPDRLENGLPKTRERGMIAFGSGVTDPYQPIESVEQIIKKCAETLASA